MAGLGRNASYRAATTGQIPTIKLGRKLRVPASLWKSILDGRVVPAVGLTTPESPLICQKPTSTETEG